MLGFPLLLIPFAIYNMIAFITPMDWGTKLYTFHLMSGLEWSPTLGDALIVFSLLMLMFEFIKSNNHGKSIVEHFLSIVLAAGAAAEFVMVKEAANSVFALFVAICFVDMFAGFSASWRRARRNQAAEAPMPHPAPVPYPAPAPRAEPLRADPDVRLDPVVPPARMDAATRVEPAASPFSTPPRAEPPVVRPEPVQKTEP